MNNSELGSRPLSKVPEVTIYFWVIKVLCTTVGETAADFLNVNLNLGLTGTSIVTGILLVVALIVQFRVNRYIPVVYWIAVVLISVFGTLVTDNLSDNFGVPLEVSTLVFAAALLVTFAVWFAVERTLSIHSIFSIRREVFYWLAILFTFALGTASGDLMAERLGFGYLVTGGAVAAVVAVFAVAWRLKLDSILSFWVVYILTRPLGASLGDLLSQSPDHGGLGLGATLTSVVFLAAIVLTVVYLSFSKRDSIAALAETPTRPRVLAVQVAVVLTAILVVSATGYWWRSSQLAAPAPAAQATAPLNTQGPLGDLSQAQTITADTLKLVLDGKLAEAATRVADLEFWWDQAEARLRPRSPETWKTIDSAIDKVLRQLRAAHQDPTGCQSSLQALAAQLK